MNSKLTGGGCCKKNTAIFGHKEWLLSKDMKTKVVQHVPRINLSYFKFQIFFKFSNFFKEASSIPQSPARPGACTICCCYVNNDFKEYFHWSRPVENKIIFVNVCCCTRPRAGDWGNELASFHTTFHQYVTHSGLGSPPGGSRCEVSFY